MSISTSDVSAYAVVHKDNAGASIRRDSLYQLVQIVGNIVDCVRIAGSFTRPAFARVSWGSTLTISVVRENPRTRREARSLKEFNGWFPDNLWETKPIEADE